MRDAYHDDLDAVSATLVSMAAMVDNAIVRASKALLESDRALAEEVIAADAAIDTVQHELDNRTVDLMARQAATMCRLDVLAQGIEQANQALTADTGCVADRISFLHRGEGGFVVIVE